VGRYEKGNEKESDAVNFLVTLKPDLFMPLKDFREQMAHLYKRIVGDEKIDGVNRIYFPGEIE
jgi:LDH2 family malate/lactate/ureidoglycolate dehydrogenase